MMLQVFTGMAEIACPYGMMPLKILQGIEFFPNISLGGEPIQDSLQLYFYFTRESIEHSSRLQIHQSYSSFHLHFDRR